MTSCLQQLSSQRDQALADLDRQRQTNRQEVETWEQAYAQLQEEAAQAAMAYEQQIAEQPVRTAPPRN